MAIVDLSTLPLLVEWTEVYTASSMSGPTSDMSESSSKRRRESNDEPDPLQLISEALGVKILPLGHAPFDDPIAMAHCKMLTNVRKLKWFTRPFILNSNGTLQVGKLVLSGAAVDMVSFAIQAKQKGCDIAYVSSVGAIAFEPFEIKGERIHHWYSVAVAPSAKAAEPAIPVLAKHLKATLQTGDLQKLREVYAAITSHMSTRQYTGGELKAYIESIDGKESFKERVIGRDQVPSVLATVHSSLVAYCLSGCTLSERIRAVKASPQASLDMLARVLLAAPTTQIPVSKFAPGQGVDDAGQALKSIQLGDAKPDDSIITGVQITTSFLRSIQATDLVFIKPPSGVYKVKGKGTVAELKTTLATAKDMQDLLQLAKTLRVDTTPVEPAAEEEVAPADNGTLTTVNSLF